MDIGSLFSIIFASIFINNFVLARFLGICPFMGVSKKVESSIGMGYAVIFVMTFASAITWLINKYVLVKFNIEYLETIAFILIIASLVQAIEMVIKKVSPNLYEALGVFLPLITTNCAVLGVAILNIDLEYNFIETIVNGFGGGVGFMIALVLLAGIRERLEYSDIPKSFQGISIVFITAGLMAISFIGFSGMKI